MDGLYKELSTRQLAAVRGGATEVPGGTKQPLVDQEKPAPSGTIKHGWMIDPGS